MLAQWYPPCQAWPTAATRARLLATLLPEHGWQTIVLAPDMTGGACVAAAGAPTRAAGSGRGAWNQGAPACLSGGRPSGRLRLSARAQAMAQVRRARSSAAPPAPDARASGERRGSLAEAMWLLGDVHSNWARVAADPRQPAARARRGRRHMDDLGPVRPPPPRPPARPGLRPPLGGRYPRPCLHRRHRPAGDPGEGGESAALGLPAPAPGGHGRSRPRPGRSPLLDGPWLGREPLVLVPGFDDREWATARSRASANADRFEIVFTGKLYETYRRPDAFLRGLREAVDRIGPEHRSRLRFVYYGRSGDFLRGLAEDLGCAELVDDRGFVDPGGRAGPYRRRRRAAAAHQRRRGLRRPGRKVLRVPRRPAADPGRPREGSVRRRRALADWRRTAGRRRATRSPTFSCDWFSCVASAMAGWRSRETLRPSTSSRPGRLLGGWRPAGRRGCGEDGPGRCRRPARQLGEGNAG